ncbi:acid phosphatase [Flavobacterium hungaricum]|uniref:Acid phosphatase n=1 Tax=Flavobacterium hungaricum TaxID=2082725 RepID=A0ABR9TJH0_9FLAO|nr:phosphatase PAP2 family protein [Flavobacterium hungaricum]MBE8725506.1 phosphatase PAP2 family protein [Flavobacterium hungaricum]
MGLKIIEIINSLVYKCFKRNNVVSKFTTVEQLRAVIPDLLHGYLTEEEMPNSLVLLSPPPEIASPAYEIDLEHAKRAVESENEIRFIKAASDADLSFPAAAKCFGTVLEIEINEHKTPKLYVFMRRVMTDAGLSTYAAKNHYNRVRPFVVNNKKTCTPDQEEVLKKVGSFPSGHAAVGMAWALILIEIFPKHREVILKRGHDFGESRIICNAHWHSDVEMGRIMGKATVETLFANPAFLADLKEVKKELLGIVLITPE